MKERRLCVSDGFLQMRVNSRLLVMCIQIYIYVYFLEYIYHVHKKQSETVSLLRVNRCTCLHVRHLETYVNG